MTPPCVDCGRERKTKPISCTRRCSACEKRRWRERNPERNREQRKAYRERNRAALAAKQAEWKEKNRQHIRDYECRARELRPDVGPNRSRRAYLRHAPVRLLGPGLPGILYEVKQVQLEMMRFAAKPGRKTT